MNSRKRIVISGLSATGKSSLLDELVHMNLVYKEQVNKSETVSIINKLFREGDFSNKENNKFSTVKSAQLSIAAFNYMIHRFLEGYEHDMYAKNINLMNLEIEQDVKLATIVERSFIDTLFFTQIRFDKYCKTSDYSVLRNIIKLTLETNMPLYHLVRKTEAIILEPSELFFREKYKR